MKVRVEISPAELLDKISILEIKQERIVNADKLENVRSELALLDAARRESIEPRPELLSLVAELRDLNLRLWELEDDVRRLEREGRFDDVFIACARDIYAANDRRAETKCRSNLLLGSSIVEEKSYGP